MTLNLAAIFGAETGADGVTTAPVHEFAVNVPLEVFAKDSGGSHPTSNPAPIVEGAEHFSIWVHDDPAAAWPEFIPGLHHDIRQPSRLRPLLARPAPESH